MHLFFLELFFTWDIVLALEEPLVPMIKLLLDGLFIQFFREIGWMTNIFQRLWRKNNFLFGVINFVHFFGLDFGTFEKYH